jgi:hypothetical protein
LPPPRITGATTIVSSSTSARWERLANDVGAAHHVHILARRCITRALDRVLDAVDEREGDARRLLLGPVRGRDALPEPSSSELTLFVGKPLR